MAEPGRGGGGADLHVHTTHSDGAMAPGDVVRAAAVAGLAAVAITDHDTLSAVAVARPEAERLGVELVAGIELSAERDGRTLHILGHFVDDHDPGLRAAAEALRVGRVERFAAMVEALRARGLAVDPAAIRRAWPRAALGRRHLADHLAATGQIPTARAAFARLLADGAAGIPPAPRLGWREAIALIRSAGGTAALAHPGRHLGDGALREMAATGLAAIEVDWPGQAAARVRQARARAARLGLVPLAGSDFHAPGRGIAVGSRATPRSDLEALRARARPGCPAPDVLPCP